MSAYSNILVVLDPTASDPPAVSKAMQLAIPIHADVELLICDTRASYEERLPRQAPLSADVVDDKLREWIELLATPLRDAGLRVNTAITRGDSLHTTILNWLRNSPADLVVKDTHHHPDARAPLPLPVTHEALDAEREVHVNAVSRLLQNLEVPVGSRYVSMGVPSEFLPRMAEQLQVDIMIMGALSRSHLKQSLIGSTAERLLEYLPCDILTVKPVNWSHCLPF